MNKGRLSIEAEEFVLSNDKALKHEMYQVNDFFFCTFNLINERSKTILSCFLNPDLRSIHFSVRG